MRSRLPPTASTSSSSARPGSTRTGSSWSSRPTGSRWTTSRPRPCARSRTRRSSPRVRAVADGRADAVVSAGNTGAMLAAGLLHLRRLPGVLRPAIAVPLPTAKGPSVLIDAGANADTRPEHLLQFALHGRGLRAGDPRRRPAAGLPALDRRGAREGQPAHARGARAARRERPRLRRQRRGARPARGRRRRLRLRRLHRQRGAEGCSRATISELSSTRSARRSPPRRAASSAGC